MTSIKQNSSTHGKADDDIFIEEFARDFFGTNQPDNESLLSEKTEMNPTDYKKERRKHEETYTPKTHITDKKKSDKKRETQRKLNALKNNNRDSSHNAYPNDSRQSLMKRFLELRDEFLSLSDRLHEASMPSVAKKLTQVLTERQRLVKILLDMDASTSSDLGRENEEKRSHDQSRSINGSSKQEFGMPKKTKSVHWSDEHLGGSIIHDPSLYVHQTSNSTSTHDQAPRKYRELNNSKPPPSYKTVDRQTQTLCGRESKTDSRRDLNQCCNMNVDLELEYVETILNEAAELRREACCMIWRAHYLEQLCDVDGLVKHVYRSTSNVPTLPRYSHLYR